MGLGGGKAGDGRLYTVNKGWEICLVWELGMTLEPVLLQKCLHIVVVCGFVDEINTTYMQVVYRSVHM
jgi:hypothetical protein